MSLGSGEGFKEYAHKWRDLAGRVQPPLTDRELVDMFLGTLSGPFYNHLIGVEVEDVMRGDFHEGFSLYPLCKIIHNHDEEFVLVRPLHEWSEDVHPPPRERPWGRQCAQLVGGGARCMSACLWHLSHFLTCSLASCCIVGQ